MKFPISREELKAWLEDEPDDGAFYVEKEDAPYFVSYCPLERVAGEKGLEMIVSPNYWTVGGKPLVRLPDWAREFVDRIDEVATFEGLEAVKRVTRADALSILEGIA